MKVELTVYVKVSVGIHLCANSFLCSVVCMKMCPNIHTSSCVVFSDKSVSVISSSVRHHSLPIMRIMQSHVCLPQALVIQPGANNELSIWQGNLKDRVVSFPDAMAFGSVNTG